MTKKLLTLISTFVDSKNPKLELNYALVDFENNVVVATDTRRIIKANLGDVHVEGCSGTHLVHKKILGAICTMSTNDTVYSFMDNCIVLDGFTSISLSNANFEFKYPNFNDILDTQFDDVITLGSLEFVDFELTHLDTHINVTHLFPAIEHSQSNDFHVHYKKQTQGEQGKAKIVAFSDDGEIIYQALYMGVLFKPQHPTLF
jgi:hypothetical protein